MADMVDRLWPCDKYLVFHMFLSCDQKTHFPYIVFQYCTMANHTERSPLLMRHDATDQQQSNVGQDSITKDPEATAEEIKMADTAVGERLKYNDYTTIDWLHDLVISIACGR